MRLSFRLAAVKTLRKKKKKEVEGRRSIVKDDSKSDVTCKDIPEDILIEILVRLPAYSLMRFKCVSKLWSSLISSRYFTNLFFKFSSSIMREHRMFVYALHLVIPNDYMLFSSSLSNLKVNSFLQLNRSLTLPQMEDCSYFLNALRGMVCFIVRRAIQIINLTTRQVLNLPLVKSNMFLEINCYRWNYFGYDTVNDEYKVLTTISELSKAKEGWRVISETQVFVLGDGASWRITKSVTSPPPPHYPHGGGISINGVLYYGARSYENRSVLMSFDFNSEEFNLIELPTEAHFRYLFLANLMNYQGQVALLDCSRLDTKYTLDLWVAEDAGKSKWSHKVFVLPCHQLRVSLELQDMDELYIRGTSRSGEVMLCGRYDNNNKKCTRAFYDLENNRITIDFVIDQPIHFGNRLLQTHLWEDVESIMYLEL